MSDSFIDRGLSPRQVQQAVLEIEALSISPQLAIKLLSIKDQASDFLPILLSGSVHLTANLLMASGSSYNLVETPALLLSDEKTSELIFSSPVCSDSPFFHAMTSQSLAVAIASRQLALAIDFDADRAYLAGLLSQMGNIYLQQAMPKSFASIVAEATAQNCHIADVQRKTLGIDYCVLGRRLATKFRLGAEIGSSIWLAGADISILSSGSVMPSAKLAAVLQLATLFAREAIDNPVSIYYPSGSIDQLADFLSLTSFQIDEIKTQLADELIEKSALLGLSDTGSLDDYHKQLPKIVADLAKENSHYNKSARQNRISCSHYDFVCDFVSTINGLDDYLDISVAFAKKWQKFYQSGPVIIYFDNDELSCPEAVVVENQATVTKHILQESFDLSIDSSLFELSDHFDLDLDIAKTMILSLSVSNRVIGAIIFEQRYPCDDSVAGEMAQLSDVFCWAIDVSISKHNQQLLAENFAACLSQTNVSSPIDVGDNSDSPAALTPFDLTEILTEMASGAGHEFNNPLSVISGRVQLLGSDETDPAKLKSINQIKSSADQLRRMIEDLLKIADPGPSNIQPVRLDLVLEDAVMLTCAKTSADSSAIELLPIDNSQMVLVDSAQISSALANIMTNSLQASQVGKESVVVKTDIASDMVTISIEDHGSGMEPNVLKKASWPFFSYKSAGRQPGMGLPQAIRLIELNGGTIAITSSTNNGTTVTVTLPIAS